MRTRDSIHRKNSPFYGPERFTYQPEHDRNICPAGILNFHTLAMGSDAMVLASITPMRSVLCQRSGLRQSGR